MPQKIVFMKVMSKIKANLYLNAFALHVVGSSTNEGDFHEAENLFLFL